VSKDSSKYIAGIVLAAGGSSRMKDGQQKLLLPLGDRPVLVHVIEAVLTSQLHPIVVVLGSRAAEIGQTISSYLSKEQQSHLHILENSDYTNGMSSSLHVGIRGLMDENQDTIAGAMILLGDQPFVSTEMIDALIGVEQEGVAKIVAPRYNGKRGNPVIFSSELFAELLEVVGDEGGKSVIERHRADVRMVEMEDVGQNHDVDTWEAYQKALTMWQEGLKEE
jgi:molybdenum cofactor cytidylyltransferase